MTSRGNHFFMRSPPSGFRLGVGLVGLLGQWLNAWEILARYFLAFPGALLACAGLVLQAQEVRQMGFGETARFLVGAGVAFGVYSIVGGLAAPDGPFFPASWLNYSLVQRTVGVPVPVFRSLCGLAITYTVTRSLQIFRLRAEQSLAAMRRQRLLAEERERISRDLHDSTIQSIYGAGLRLQSALQNMEHSPGEAREQEELLAFRGLSDQEMRILARIAEGKTNKEIGDELHLSEKTVRNYVSEILAKLGLSSRVQAAAYAARYHIERHAPP